jgi:hypothetical protein
MSSAFAAGIVVTAVVSAMMPLIIAFTSATWALEWRNDMLTLDRVIIEED